ncbi:MAG TPA: hypothetical protein VHB50_22340 [Bryobacteraceae bacterium]|jgi:hypothetical protein|nr:hypothetical protein [Bryobacteraceae bacterium]
MNKRLTGALAAYAVLIAASCALLHGVALKIVLLLFVMFIAKTLIAWRAGW